MTYSPPQSSAVDFSWEGSQPYTPSAEFSWGEGYLRPYHTTANASWAGAEEYTRLPLDKADATWQPPQPPSGIDITAVWIDDAGTHRSANQHLFPQVIPETQYRDTDQVWIDSDGNSYGYDEWLKLFERYTYSPKYVPEIPPIELPLAPTTLRIQGVAQLITNAIRATGSISLQGQATLWNQILQGAGSIKLQGLAELHLINILDCRTGVSINFSTKATIADSWYTPRPTAWLYRVPFVDPPEKAVKLIAPYVDPERKDPKHRIPWGDAVHVDEDKTHLWDDHVVLDRFWLTKAGEFTDRYSKDYTPPWKFPNVLDQFQYYPWSPMDFHFLEHPFPYARPEVKDLLPSFKWDELNTHIIEWINRAGQAPVKDLWWHIVWGPVSYVGKYWNCIPTWGMALEFNLVRRSRVNEIEVDDGTYNPPISSRVDFTWQGAKPYTPSTNFQWSEEEVGSIRYTRPFYSRADATWEMAEPYTRLTLTTANARFISPTPPPVAYLYDTMLEATYAVLFDETGRVSASNSHVRKLALPPVEEGDKNAVWISPTGSVWSSGINVTVQDPADDHDYVEEDDVFVPEPFDLSLLRFDLLRLVNTQCEWVPPYDTGPKDNYWELPDIIPTFPPPEGAGRSLYIMSEASLVRASDNAMIAVLGMSIDTDIDSWCYTFRATLGNKAALDLCKPTLAGAVEVIATINGYAFHMYIEGYSERGAFGKTQYSVVGRSIAVEFAAPYAEPSSHTYTGALNISQLFDQERSRVDGPNNWVASWDFTETVNESIPANTFTYQDKTPIENMVALAKSCGGFVTHDRNAKVIRVKPVYKKNPWDFAPADADVQLDHSYIVSTGHDWKPSPVKNGIFVAGTTDDGWLGKIQRLGSDGLSIVPMVTDPLIVTVALARERGRYEINKTGRKGEYSLELPISVDVPLFESGQVVRVYEASPTNWYGVVMGVSLQAQRSSGGPTIVRQQVKLERHYEQ